MATLKDAGIHLDLSTTQINNLIDQEVLPKFPRGQIDLDVYRTNYIRHQRAQIQGRRNSNRTLDDERVRLISAQASHEELKVQEKEESLIPADEVRQLVIGKVLSARAVLLSLPSRIAPKVMSATTVREVEDYAREMIYQALNDLADGLPEDSVQLIEEFTEYQALNS